MVPNRQNQVKIFEILKKGAFAEIRKILALDLSAGTMDQELKTRYSFLNYLPEVN